MMQYEPQTKKHLSGVGQEIGYELGYELVNKFQVANPNNTHFYIIGRNIIDQILAQPGCVAIKFLYALNENEEKTLVYVGLNSEGKCILNYSFVNVDGKLSNIKGIVADRIDRGGPSIDSDDWNWEVE